MPEFLGFANQNMSTPSVRAAGRRLFTAFNPGDTSWICPATGYYTWTLRGGGGGTSGGNGGGAGGSCQVTVLLFRNQVVTFSVGRGVGRSINANGGDTVLTFRSGLVVTGGGGVSGNSGGAGGAATGGDINIAGSASVGGLGGVAPAIGAYSAGATAISNNQDGPGTGASTSGGGTSNGGGSGIIYLQAGKV